MSERFPDSAADLRQYAPAVKRNQQPILEVLQRLLPESGTVLEIASGTGEHAAFFASHLPQLDWVPSEPQRELHESISAWSQQVSASNLRSVLALDVAQSPWPVELDDFQGLPIVAVVNINMIHISAWEMCEHLLAGAHRILPPGGLLYLYGAV